MYLECGGERIAFTSAEVCVWQQTVVKGSRGPGLLLLLLLLLFFALGFLSSFADVVVVLRPVLSLTFLVLRVPEPFTPVVLGLLVSL